MGKTAGPLKADRPAPKSAPMFLLRPPSSMNAIVFVQFCFTSINTGVDSTPT
jgi:hypothetical protein